MAANSSCPAPMKAVSNGPLQGDNPLEYALPSIIFQTCIVVVLTRLRQPRVVAEIIGGILLGPSALGRSKKFLDNVFPSRSLTVLDTIANIGLLFYLFRVGLELELRAIRRTGKRALAIAVAGISLPFIMGIGTSFVLRSTVNRGVREGPFLVFMGIALSITAFPVLAELKLLTTDLGGRMAVSAAAINDVAAWILLALAIALSGTGFPIITLSVLLATAAFVVFAAVCIRPVLNWMAQRSAEGEPVKEVYICATLVIVLAAGFAMDAIGIHALFGGLVVGIVVPKDGTFAGLLIEKMEDLVSALFLPLYFVSSGLKTNVAAIRGQCSSSFWTNHARSSSSSSISASEISQEFAHHDPNVARLNNGSFGCCPASILAAQLNWQYLYLRQPDDFYDNLLQPSILRSRSIIKELINATDIEEVSIVDNVSTAAAIVFQRFSWAFAENAFQRGDIIVILQHTYPAVRNCLHAYVSRAGGRVIEIPTPFPVASSEEIICSFRKALTDIKSSSTQHKIRLAVMDHVMSVPSMVIPVKELTKICREEGVGEVFIDGAHAIGNVEVNVEDIGADYYTSNLHKWFFCPPAAAFLHCRRGIPDLHHPVVSYDQGKGLPAECSWVGTRDYSPQLVLPSIMDFVNRFQGGIEGIQRRNHEQAVKMGKMLADAWNTHLGSPPDMCSSALMVGLPECLGISSDADACRLRTHLREEGKVEVHVYYHNNNNAAAAARQDGELEAADYNVNDHKRRGGSLSGYVRICHQVYNVADDYYKLRDAVSKLVNDGFNCRMLSA